MWKIYTGLGHFVLLGIWVTGSTSNHRIAEKGNLKLELVLFMDQIKPMTGFSVVPPMLMTVITIALYDS